MRELVSFTQDSVAWEAENVPGHIGRDTVKGPPALMHMTFRRKEGDFLPPPLRYMEAGGC